MNKTGGISCHHVRQDQNGSYQETKQVPTLLNTKDNKTDLDWMESPIGISKKHINIRSLVLFT